MWPSVSAFFQEFNEPFEGSIPWFYLDVRGLVTIGVGNLVDPLPVALSIPMTSPDGTPASPSQITSDWNVVKSRQSLASSGARAFESLTTTRLIPSALSSLIQTRLASNDLVFSRRFSNWASWPADAQLGILSMAWAVGAGAILTSWPHFWSACLGLNFLGAAAQSQISTVGNPGVIPRNSANELCFSNAAGVISSGSDRSVLWYPKTFGASLGASS